MEFGPIIGAEKLRISFGNANASGKYTSIVMNIQKIAKVEGFKGHQEASDTIVELILVDEHYHYWNSNAWSRSWTDTSISDIVKDIAKDHCFVDFDSFENTNEKIAHFDTHQRTPAECVTWLLSRASGVVSKQPGYCIHRYNEPGSDTFVHRAITLEQLLAQTKWMNPVAQENGIASYYFGNVQSYYVNLIKKFEINLVDFTAMKTLTGETLLGYDIKRKKLIQQDYSFVDALSRYTILGAKTLFPESIKIERPVTNVVGSDSEVFLDNIWYGKWIKEYCNQQFVRITVNGHEDRHVGGMIRILWPTMKNYSNSDDKQNVEKYNKQMDGKYLVKSITHYFSPTLETGWLQKLTCIKNGYKDSSNQTLINATKVNL